jgi:hypothetical protein
MTEDDMRAMALDYALRVSRLCCHRAGCATLTDAILNDADKILSWLQDAATELVFTVSPPVEQP